jgi:protein SCO1
MNNRSTPALALVAFLLIGFAGAAARAAQHDQHAGHAKPKATRKAAPSAKKRAAAHYVCPMHPEVTSARPGKCPKCGMNLRAAAARAEGKAAADPQQREAPAAAPSPGGSTGALSEAPKIPDVPVVDQDGKELKFYTDLVKGKTVAINFIFTTCTTVCPPLTATFRRVQQTLAERAGTDIHLISISVDPATDTPPRLKDFSAKFKAGPGWTFVTGGVPEINSLLRALGAGVGDKNDHTPTVIVGNERAGHWTRAYGLSPAASLVKVIDEAAAKGAASAQAAAPAPAAAPAVEKSGAAAYFPNHVLLTQDGRPVRFYDDLLKGKIVLINFMFTTCAGVCSPMTANLAKVQTQLGDRVGKDVVMLSISVDPAVDTPETLKKYAAKFKAGPGWHFLTGKKENVDWVLYKLGGYVEDKSKHTGVLIIGNEATGEWVKTVAMKSPTEISEAVLALLKADKN